MLKGIMGDMLNRALTGGLNPPRPTWPANQQSFNYYAGPLPLRWEPVDKAEAYEVQVDCLDCQTPGKWPGDSGQPWRSSTNLSGTEYRVDLASINMNGQWRWRVRAARDGRKSKWSDWAYFSFQTQTGGYAPNYPSQRQGG